MKTVSAGCKVGANRIPRNADCTEVVKSVGMQPPIELSFKSVKPDRIRCDTDAPTEPFLGLQTTNFLW